MFQLLTNLFAPSIKLTVRNIGNCTEWQGRSHPHTATSWRWIRSWKTFLIGDFLQLGEYTTLVVREVTHVLDSDVPTELVLDFAMPHAKAGYEMKKLGFQFYHHHGTEGWLRPLRTDPVLSFKY